jgi:hypothetical protein
MIIKGKQSNDPDIDEVYAKNISSLKKKGKASSGCICFSTKTNKQTKRTKSSEFFFQTEM